MRQTEIPTQRASSVIQGKVNYNQQNGSHQSKIRHGLQQKNQQPANNNAVSRASSVLSKITIVRETQSIRVNKNAVGKYTIGGGDTGDATSQTDPKTVDSSLAYKDISNKIYYPVTLLYFGLMILGAIVIPAVDIIFDFVGAITVNCVAFIFPSVFYLLARKVFKNNIQGKQYNDYHANNEKLIDGQYEISLK